MKVSGKIPNLINGVSQQSPPMRLASQADICENTFPSIVDGLTPRPRTEHGIFLGNIPNDAFKHFIMRDDAEEYILAIYTNGTIRVWDRNTGAEKTVDNHGASYLAGITSAEDDLRALTIADHTFIVNRKKVVLAGTSKTPARPYEALVHVAAGNYAKTYRITIGGSLVAEYTTPDGSTASHGYKIDTVNIAQELYADCVANSLNVSPWGVGRYGSSVYLTHSTNDFNIAADDGYSGRAMKAIKGVVQKFSDLPAFAIDGFIVKVAGTETTKFDDYWVQYGVNGSSGTGVWKECPAPDTPKGVDASTMPHILVRNADGTFTFKAATWGERQCGDVKTVPNPSFVGQAIEDVFFHRNRFCILTGENVVMSESGEFYNFFRSTLTAVLDTDPIDIASAHNKISFLRHPVAYQDSLIIFSNNTQFRLSATENLTPKSVSLRALTEFPNSPTIKPVVAQSNIYFVTETAEWASLMEFFVDKGLETAEGEPVSSHAPAYVPAGVKHMSTSPELDIILLATDGDPGAIYLYKYYWSGREKLQSAWTRWTFPGCTRIEGMAFDKARLVILARREDGLYAETLNLSPHVTDPNIDYLFSGDRFTVLSGGVYNSVTNKTTFTLPYARPNGLAFVSIAGPNLNYPDGVELIPSSVTTNTVSFDGDLSNVSLRCGIPFLRKYRFSTLFNRSQDGKQTVISGRLNIKHMTIYYSNAAYFTVEVEAEGREKRIYPFNSKVIGSAKNKTAVFSLISGRFTVPILSRNDRVTITIVSDSWLPASFTSAEWQGDFNPNTKEL